MLIIFNYQKEGGNRMVFCISYDMFRERIISSASFIVYYGAKGIGKTTAIHENILRCDEVCSWDYIFISAKTQLSDIPLSAIAMATGIKADTSDYFHLYRDITSRSKCLLHIENPSELNQDALKLLDNAICYLLNSGKSSCKVILEYDQEYPCFSQAISCMNPINSCIQAVSPISHDAFVSSLMDSYPNMPINTAQTLSLAADCNFGLLNEVLLWLIMHRVLSYDSEGRIDYSNLTPRDIEVFKKETIEDQYSHLSEDQCHVISQASIIGNTVYGFLLEEALAIPRAAQIMSMISTNTNLISAIESDGLYSFIDIATSDYMFVSGVHDYILSRVPLHDRYIAQKKLADYLEVVFSNENSRYMKTSHMLLLAKYYCGINLEKEIEYMQMAASNYEQEKLFATSAFLYWNCFTKDIQQIRFAISAFKCWLQAEQYEEVAKHYLQYSLAKRNEPWIEYLYAKSQYCMGDVQVCLKILESLINHNILDITVSFCIHSLLASSYDWINNARLRKRHFGMASRLVNQLSGDICELAQCSLWKKCTMCQSFELPQVRHHMITAYHNYMSHDELCSAYECALNIGNEFLFCSDFSNAYNYMLEAFEGFLTIRSRQIYVAHNSLGILFLVQGHYSNALKHFRCISTDTIEPFCRISVQINTAIALLHLDNLADAKAILSQLRKDPALFSHPDMRIVATHYYLSTAFMLKAEQNDVEAIQALESALGLCDTSNSNFTLLHRLCVLMKIKWSGEKLDMTNVPLISKLCCQKEITICDIMCWR